MNGDFNLGKLHDWRDDTVDRVRDKINERISNRDSIGSESSQILEAIDFVEKWNLKQNVKNPTRDNNILHRLFTSDEIVSDVKLNIIRTSQIMTLL